MDVREGNSIDLIGNHVIDPPSLVRASDRRTNPCYQIVNHGHDVDFDLKKPIVSTVLFPDRVKDRRSCPRVGSLYG
jgi:hypothetical protein